MRLASFWATPKIPHTQWNARAEKLRRGWQRGSSVLSRVRAVASEMYELLFDRVEREDPFALVEFFSVPKSAQPTSGRKPVTGGPSEIPETAPKAFRIQKRSGGFALLPGPALQEDQLPMQVRVRCAYDVLSGNPFRRFSEYDFSFYGTNLKVERTQAQFLPREPNEIEVEVRRADFKIEVTGFDPNRDLIIEARG